MLCPVGRTLDETHPTCASCQAQGAPCKHKQVKKPRKRYRSGPGERHGRRLWFTDYDLQSLNTHVQHPQGAKVYLGIKKQWERILRGAVYHFGKADGPRSVEVVRTVPGRQWLYDDENLWGSCKPLCDVLVQMGILVDDNHRWRESLEPKQMVGGELKVEIFVW